jgi:hypothetical protein
MSPDHAAVPIGFAGAGLGAEFENDLFVGAATPALMGGYLFRFDTGSGDIEVDDPRLEDGVADNLAKHDVTESESLLIGRDFGIVTDVETGPDGDLYVVSPTRGAIYRVFATGNSLDIADVVTTNGNRGRVTGTFTCDAGDVVLLELELTRDDASASGRQRAACTGATQKLRIGFATSGPAFSDGQALACVAMSTAAPGARTTGHAGEQCQPVTIDVH